MSTCVDLPSTGPTPSSPPDPDDFLRRQNASLHLRVARLEDALRAILGDEVDALFVGDGGSRRMFTLDGADRPYRSLIEQMGEGALTLTSEGVVAYANRRFAELLDRPLQQLIGSRIEESFAPPGYEALEVLLKEISSGKRSAELDLLTAAGLRVPVLVSVSPLSIEGLPGALGLIATDLSRQRRSEAAIEARHALERMVSRVGVIRPPGVGIYRPLGVAP
jgi:PAS domain S-box-containing protein